VIALRLIRRVSAPAVVVALACAAAHAQPYRVTAFIDPQVGITESQPVRLVIEIAGGDLPHVTSPRLEAAVNLELLSGPNRSTSISWINGKTSAKTNLTYVLMPIAPGPAEIPALDIHIGTFTYRTEPLTFVVGAARPRTPGGAGSPGGGGPAATEALFLRAELAKQEVWVGEPVPLDLTLYAIPRISGFVLRKRPDFANFWVETLDNESEMLSYQTRIGNHIYAAYPIERQILIPPSAGDFELRPYVAQLQVRASRNRAPSFFGFGRTESVVLKSDPLVLKVRRLPEQGHPSDFSGAVGSYRMDVALDRSEALVNDAVALKVTVEGVGSLRSVRAPALPDTTDLKVFEPQIKESVVTKRDRQVVSRKTWEWILVPLTPGEVRIPTLRFSYFDPASETYVTADGGELMLAVERGEPFPDRPGPRAQIFAQRRELAFIKPRRGNLSESHRRAHEQGIFIALAVLPLGLTPLLIVIRRQRERLQQDQGLARARKARARARKSFRAVQRQLDTAEAAVFHEQVARALVEYVSDRFDRSAAGLTYDVAEELLVSRGVPAELRRRFRSCLESCDFARFVPAAGRTERRAEVLEEASAIVEELERSG